MRTSSKTHLIASFEVLLAIKANPLTGDEVAMFDMSDREWWSDDRCRQHILDQLREPA